MKALQRIAGGRSDGADSPSDRAQIRIARIEPFEKKPHAVRAGEDQPVVIAQVRDGLIERRVIGGRLNLDGGQFDHLGAQTVQEHQLAHRPARGRA